jgi:hypothetical protein
MQHVKKQQSGNPAVRSPALHSQPINIHHSRARTTLSIHQPMHAHILYESTCHNQKRTNPTQSPLQPQEQYAPEQPTQLESLDLPANCDCWSDRRIRRDTLVLTRTSLCCIHSGDLESKLALRQCDGAKPASRVQLLETGAPRGETTFTSSNVKRDRTSVTPNTHCGPCCCM